MTSSSDSIDISLSGMYRSWYAFRAGKRLSRAIISFEYNLEYNLAQLTSDLQNKHYRHGEYKRMVVNDSKRRTIAVAAVRDRVVHRLLYDYFVPLMDYRFDYDVWSCRVNKGLQSAIKRTQVLLCKYPEAWIWRCDVTKFFDSVDHDVLRSIVTHYITDPVALELLDRVIESYHTNPGKGIAIGNLTSQILSNVYLNEFDRFVRHYIKPLAYVRYGDDFILLLPTQQAAKEASIIGEQFLVSRLRLTINPRSTIIVRSRDGLIFLGVVLFASGTKLQKRTWQRLQKRLAPVNQSSYWGLIQTLGSNKQKEMFSWLNLKEEDPNYTRF